jgi:hypothetical protein
MKANRSTETHCPQHKRSPSWLSSATRPPAGNTYAARSPTNWRIFSEAIQGYPLPAANDGYSPDTPKLGFRIRPCARRGLLLLLLLPLLPRLDERLLASRRQLGEMLPYARPYAAAARLQLAAELRHVRPASRQRPGPWAGGRHLPRGGGRALVRRGGRVLRWGRDGRRDQRQETSAKGDHAVARHQSLTPSLWG